MIRRERRFNQSNSVIEAEGAMRGRLKMNFFYLLYLNHKVI